MQTFAVSLPDELVATVRERAKASGYRDESVYLANLVSTAVLRELREQLDLKLAEGLRELEQGHGEQATPEFWRKLRERLELPPVEIAQTA